jgi:hypothetical protein
MTILAIAGCIVLAASVFNSLSDKAILIIAAIIGIPVALFLLLLIQ